jgi:hypothetical protein
MTRSTPPVARPLELTKGHHGIKPSNGKDLYQEVAPCHGLPKIFVDRRGRRWANGCELVEDLNSYNLPGPKVLATGLSALWCFPDQIIGGKIFDLFAVVDLKIVPYPLGGQ